MIFWLVMQSGSPKFLGLKRVSRKGVLHLPNEAAYAAECAGLVASNRSIFKSGLAAMVMAPFRLRKTNELTFSLLSNDVASMSRGSWPCRADSAFASSGQKAMRSYDAGAVQSILIG